jgi:hypothetical protein
MFNRSHTEETKKKMSESKKGKPSWNKGISNITKTICHCGKLCPRWNKNFCSYLCYREHKRKLYDESIQERLNVGEKIHPQVLRKYLLKKFGWKCSSCGLKEWMNRPIPLNLDHRDGNSENNTEENFRFLCLNCDGLQPTYGSKNRGNGRAYRRQRYKDGKSS